MSFENVRPYFRTRLEGLGFTEHRDAFDFSNIPQSILDDSFHLETGVINGSPGSHLTHLFTYPVIVRVFKRGFLEAADALDNVDSTVKTIMDDLLAPINRLGTDIKDIVPINYQPIQLSGSNNNDIILQMEFQAILLLCFT